jgi:type VI secretion system protein ImpD
MPAPDDIASPGHAGRAVGHDDGLIDASLGETDQRASEPAAPAGSRIDALVDEPNAWPALIGWLQRGPTTRCRVLDDLDRLVAGIDERLNAQLNAILHHPDYQRLEASWRGLSYLVWHTGGQPGIKVRVLNLPWRELVRDLDRAIEFDQSQFFNKIYTEEFGSPGGEPFGVILGDYAFSHRIASDMEAIESLSHVAAAAFAPMVMGADSALFGLDQFAGLGPPVNLPRIFQQTEYLKWRAFRDTEDARFIGLVMPRVLMRTPHRGLGARVDGFRFREEVAGPDSGRYLWGNAIYALGSVLVREFAESGWLASIQGVERGVESGGLVTGLPQHDFATDAPGVASRISTDVLITDADEKMLGELGFMPLSHCKDTPWGAFYGSASVQKPKHYDEVSATVNARLSSMLQYMFCVSRFAHYLKVIGRDRIGSFATAEEVENTLQRWLIGYTIDDDEASTQAKAKAPLREGRVEVRELPGKPGKYYCVMHLRPHFQLDQVVTAVKLVTEVTSGE